MTNLIDNVGITLEFSFIDSLDDLDDFHLSNQQVVLENRRRFLGGKMEIKWSEFAILMLITFLFLTPSAEGKGFGKVSRKSLNLTYASYFYF